MARTPKLPVRTLQQLGLTERDYKVYVALAKLGTASLRRIAEQAGHSRSTVHDTLKRLIDKGLVRYLDATRHRYFTAEDPAALRALATRAEVQAQEAKGRIDALMPELEQLMAHAGHRPAVQYYEGREGIKAILEDVLAVVGGETDPVYRVYSSAEVRDLIASAWPSWNRTRKRKGVSARAIAIGEGGSTHGLDERKWLSRSAASPTYIFIYGNRTAYVAADIERKLFGVVIDDKGITTSQRMIFDALWDAL